MTKEDMVERIIRDDDKLRIDLSGGYESDYVVENGNVY